MSNLGLDYSWARPDLNQVAARGYRFICRYLSYESGKNISVNELNNARSLGLDVVLVWETTANRALSGWNGGVADGLAAAAQRFALGVDTKAPQYYAVDFDAAPRDQSAIDAYLRGANSVLPCPTGVYGSYYVVERCLANGSAVLGWQTLAWSGGLVSPHAHLYQNGKQDFNGTCDVNVALQDYYGHIDQSAGGFLMALSDSEQAEVLASARSLQPHIDAVNKFAADVRYAIVPDEPPFSAPRAEVVLLARKIDAMLEGQQNVAAALNQVAAALVSLGSRTSG